MEANTTSVPLNKIVTGGEINARASDRKGGVDALASSIRALGLLQPLCVRPIDKGRYQVIDGNRLHAALSKLAKDGELPKAHPVPVIVRVDLDGEALAASLAANVMQLPLHPVDQYEAFSRLAEMGQQAADIAASFGISEKTVRQHMALGGLSPVIRDAYRKGKIDAKAAQAFTLAPAHEVQDAAYARLKKNSYGVISDYSVRSELSDDMQRVECPEVHFVGLDAYLAAGGTLRDSLFEEDRYIADGALLKKLVHDKLEAEAERLRAEGWSFVTIDIDGDGWFDELEIEYAYTPEEEARREAIEERMNSVGHEEWRTLRAELTAIEETALLRAYTPEIKSKSGCVIGLNHNGIDVAYAMTRNGDEDAGDEDADETPPQERTPPAAWDDDAEDGEDDAGDAPDAEESDPFAPSNSMATTLSEARTRAAAAALPAIGIDAVRLAIAALRSGEYSCPIKLQAQGWPLRPRDGTSFTKAFNATAGWSDEAVLSEFARVLAGAVDTRTFTAHSDDTGSRTLLEALQPEDYLGAVRAEFQPTDYFRRQPRAAAETALQEMLAAGVIKAGVLPPRDAKKAAFAEVAARAASDCGWLPPQLRCAGYALGEVATGRVAA